ncbi:snaclec coagulation factor IX/factor X-binding protein subunit B-like [Oryzias latipes]
MEKLAFMVLAVAAARSLAAKHVFTSNRLSWTDAQEFCRNNHTDLSPLTNNVEKSVFRRSVGGDQSGWKLQGFFCLNLIVVQEEKTWEEALEHCRENHGDLTSLLSETENRLAQREIQNSTITQRVWVGLRFLGDTWKWVNGDPLEFQAWNQTGDPDQQSPVRKRCGALTKQGEWENRDCQEKLNFICI